MVIMNTVIILGGTSVAALSDPGGPGGEDLPQKGLQNGQERPQTAQKGPAQARQGHCSRGPGFKSHQNYLSC
jgi:hypothetical protein